MAKLKSVTVRGYKSIRALENFELRDLNVLIGANGAGKSNFISLFEMLAAIVERQLQIYVQTRDGPDAFLFGTRKRTQQLDAEFYFDRNAYRVSLRPSSERLVFSREETWFHGDYKNDIARPLGSGHEEARIAEVSGSGDRMARDYVYPAIRSWRVYHFHDTSRLAAMRNPREVRDNLRLKDDAANLAPFLRMLNARHPTEYKRIEKAVRQVAPFFGGFVHRESPGERVELEWFEANDRDTPRSPRQFSDGTLRFICLATLLLQPRSLLPDTILIDEPELGLHPFALNVLGELLRDASDRAQVIASTQSSDLLAQLEPEDVVVVDRAEGASTFRRLDRPDLAGWLEDFSLSDLWKSNVIGGRPA